MKTWYIIGIVVVIALALWYAYGRTPATNTWSSSLGQTEAPALSSGDTTADIASDLSQTPDTSAALNADAAASAQAVQSL